MKFNYKILHNYGNFLAVLKEIIFNVCEVREMSNDQTRAPVYEALEKLRRKRVVPFDVPGHKRGRGNPELVELLGEKCVGIDVNSMSSYKGCRRISGQGIWCRVRISYGRWNDICCAGDDIIEL